MSAEGDKEQREWRSQTSSSSNARSLGGRHKKLRSSPSHGALYLSWEFSSVVRDGRFLTPQSARRWKSHMEGPKFEACNKSPENTTWV